MTADKELEEILGNASDIKVIAVAIAGTIRALLSNNVITKEQIMDGIKEMNAKWGREQ